MNEKTWDEILVAAGAAALALGLPQLEIAASLARLAARLGCAVVGCPDDVAATLQPADVPTGDEQLAARARNKGRGR